MAKSMAEIARCSDLSSPYEHEMRVYCSTLCTVLGPRGVVRREDYVQLDPQTGYCRKCRRYFDMTPYFIAR